jgi:hypothetical protein
MPQAALLATPDAAPAATSAIAPSTIVVPLAEQAVTPATADTRIEEQRKKDERREYLEKESTMTYTSVSLGYFEPTLWLVALSSLALTFWIGRMKGSGNRTAALLLLVPLPLAMGVYGSINAIRRTFEVIGMSGTEPDPSSLYAAYASALDVALYGALLTLPAFLVALRFTLARCRRESSATK